MLEKKNKKKHHGQQNVAKINLKFLWNESLMFSTIKIEAVIK